MATAEANPEPSSEQSSDDESVTERDWAFARDLLIYVMKKYDPNYKLPFEDKCAAKTSPFSKPIQKAVDVFLRDDRLPKLNFNLEYMFTFTSYRQEPETNEENCLQYQFIQKCVFNSYIARVSYLQGLEFAIQETILMMQKGVAFARTILEMGADDLWKAMDSWAEKYIKVLTLREKMKARQRGQDMGFAGGLSDDDPLEEASGIDENYDDMFDFGHSSTSKNPNL